MTPWHVVWTRVAMQDLRKLDKTVAKRIVDSVARLAEAGNGDVRRLHGVEKEWRVRVGDWRVRLTYDEPARQMVVLRVLHRSQAYRR